MPAIRVLLVDDHKLFRAGIRSLLQTVSGVEVVAEAGDGREALHLIEAHRPDVVLMDIMMPGLNGLEATARLVRTSPHTHVIMLSMNADEDSVLQTLRAGAAGYLVKTADPAELEQAIRAVVRGEKFLSSAISNHVVAACLGRLDKEPTSLSREGGQSGPRKDNGSMQLHQLSQEARRHGQTTTLSIVRRAAGPRHPTTVAGVGPQGPPPASRRGAGRRPSGG